MREARAVNRINHPNIVEITDFGEFEGTAYLVMEYAAGESLLSTLKRGTLPWDRAVRIGEQISSALARAHEAGVIHRDLKPENVLLLEPPPNTPDTNVDRVKLTDSGIAKIMDAPALTFSEQMFGTPGYIAPEYVEGTKPDGRADLFSLGVLLYESIAGRLPWEAKGQAELLLRPLTAAPTPLAAHVPDIPPGARLASLVAAREARQTIVRTTRSSCTTCSSICSADIRRRVPRRRARIARASRRATKFRPRSRRSPRSLRSGPRASGARRISDAFKRRSSARVGVARSQRSKRRSRTREKKEWRSRSPRARRISQRTRAGSSKNWSARRSKSRRCKAASIV